MIFEFYTFLNRRPWAEGFGEEFSGKKAHITFAKTVGK